ncbi:polysaccharide deacetylase family protein [Sporomusa acidovorans]|uniref:Poly-beta-1,6-N-acetyl-D-glucosamine N-deacetylase n=1 Tax=Sporomusa acidovorans (strain ATCC 49682 / DSM 3132 / Mol) TaxID=1123286 RepID=A0ABZ3J8G6_SPOA4|nr:polysaccharide deacetylase family protein [Sporomusa acidovorans]OZC19324.1 poly-beta-1,6-N-acetyl-D-glucosamine N-deacetylase precursor [Sporomusa acidovorans DSM 3132]SDD80786.1 Polysaccharide deacetylase [Sporomusa acidovorans]
MGKEIPILMYHSVNDVPHDRNTVLTKNFSRQLHYLRTAGYHTIHLSELQAYNESGAPLPPKPVILTFDDGYEDNYTYALPLLIKYGMKATVFPVACWVGQPCGWKRKPGNDRLMSWEQIKAWQAAGMAVGAHTVHHVRLSSLSDKEIESELTEAKSILEGNLGTAIEFLCYPYGDFDDRVKFYARQTGYKAALAIFAGTSPRHPELFALPRVGISSRVPLWEFTCKIAYPRLFVGARLLETKFKNLWRHSK